MTELLRHRNALDFSFEKFHILNSCLALIFAGECEHIVRHVQSVGLSGRGDTPCR